MTAKGDCFRVAAEVAERIGGEVVHGICTGKGKIEGVRFAHAWAERGGEVYEFSNGNRGVLPAALYYRVGRVTVVARYTVEEARALMLRTEHYGPWAAELYEVS